MRRLPLIMAATLAACRHTTAQGPIEAVQRAPIELVADATGELKSTKATPLPVPGPMWSQRQLVWVAPDGSLVKAGQVIARFSAAESRLQLAQAVLDLQRNALAHAAKAGDLDAVKGRVDVDLAQVATQLGIANRYASTPLNMFARDKVLDAVQDQGYLRTKQGVLAWKRGQSNRRSATELAVLDAQRATYDLSAKTLQGNLDGLVLTAPHDGVLMLTEGWSGDKAQIGANLFAGQDFASLPDVHALEVELALPQLDAQGIQVGNAVILFPVGEPDQAIESRVSWVAGSAQVRNRESPVKYVLMKAVVSADQARTHHWVPGQRFHARIFVRRAQRGLTVPNIALITEAGRNYVVIQDGNRSSRREVVLGARGTARSEVIKGLAAGERILMLPPRGKGEGS